MKPLLFLADYFIISVFLELIQVLRKVLRFFNSFGHDAKNVGLRIEMLHELASILQLCPFRSLDISQIADFRLEGKSRTSGKKSFL